MSTPYDQFDAAYYQRYYLDPATRAASAAEQQRLADFIAGYLQYLQLSVDRVLDIGCGLGVLHQQLQRSFPEAECVGVEFSAYLCRKYGWRFGSVVEYADEPYDLVICSDVLGYLKRAACARAIKNLARLSSGALYLAVMTEEDLAVCDPEHTDMQQHTRPHRWYQQRLDPYFVAVGGGLFLRKPAPVTLWRMEHL